MSDNLPMDNCDPFVNDLLLQIEQLRTEKEQLKLELQSVKNTCQGRVGELEEKLKRILDWCNAYPVGIFKVPDLKKAHKVLKENGMTLDAISAHAMRHVLDGIKKIIEGKP